MTMPADLDLGELMELAAAKRDRVFGNRTTFSPKVFIPLTMLCRDKCGYCTFAQPPARLEAPYLTPQQVLDLARAGAAVGCHEALFTLGHADTSWWDAKASPTRSAAAVMMSRLPAYVGR